MDYRLEPVDDRDEPLCFSWDPRSGIVSGPGAEFILFQASLGSVSAHPVPCSHVLSAEPLKSREDMAAILGYEYRLPPDLAQHYPRLWDPDDYDPDVTY